MCLVIPSSARESMRVVSLKNDPRDHQLEFQANEIMSSLWEKWIRQFMNEPTFRSMCTFLCLIGRHGVGAAGQILCRVHQSVEGQSPIFSLDLVG